MAQLTGVTPTFAVKDGIREELSDLIYNISPEETPFMSNVGRDSVQNIYFEWLTDALASASSTNFVVEGDDASFSSQAGRVRLGNYAAISTKTIAVSDTARAVDSAGVQDELSYQVAKLGRELKTDMETILCGPQPAVAQTTGSTTRKTAGFEAFIRTNVNKSATSSTDPTLSGTTTGYPNAAPVQGTLRAVAETQIKDVAQKIWESGGNPSRCMVLMGPTIKTKMSAFTGIAQIRKDVPGTTAATAIGAVEVYVTDFGTLTFTPSRFLRKAASGAAEGSVLFVDPEYASVAYLQPFYVKDLASTGLAEKKVLAVEYGLKVGTEKAHGIIRDLNPAL